VPVPGSQAGSVKYGGATLVGNWQEDATLEESRLMDYLDRKDAGQLSVLQRRERTTRQLRPAQISSAPTDAHLADGATFLLQAGCHLCPRHPAHAHVAPARRAVQRQRRQPLRVHE
jgi:hypothetical protein